MPASDILWTPPPDARTRTRLGQFMTWLETHRSRRFDSYEDLWSWSVEDLEGFWSAVWEFFDVQSATPYTSVLSSRAMPGARWFEGATLNYAEHALRFDGPTVISYSQTREPVTLTTADLRRQVASVRSSLRELGVKRGDRVAAYLPNISETLVAFLACASLGGIWSSCAPEFGTRSVVDRFAQIEPTVLLTIDGYVYGSRRVDRTAEVAAIRDALPSLDHTIVIPYLPDARAVPDATAWSSLTAGAAGTAGDAELAFEPVAFDHPLYVLFSSGTTGLPKPIVHGHGGILLEHLKALGLHSDLGPGDRFFWFSTTGWMMWNLLISGLLVGSGLLLVDGDPGSPDLMSLWRLAAQTGVTYFGTSAPFLMSCRKAGLRPGTEVDLSRVRAVGSTGAPLPAEGFDWVYDAIGRDVLLSSVSGGTDVCTAFVGGTPLVPVRSGEISCRYLGCAVEAFDATGQPVVGREGELVITEPMPSMPVGFWGDPDGSKYRAAYFEQYQGVWRHGDWITITERGSCIISGRSDSTLNRGGVRIGTSDFYSVIEELPEVLDSLVVHLDTDGRLILFVTLADGVVLDDGLRSRIVTAIRSNLSPRHVPDLIEQAPAVPRTLSGKKLEVPVKRILSGADPDVAVAAGALSNPESLAFYEKFAGRDSR